MKKQVIGAANALLGILDKKFVDSYLSASLGKRGITALLFHGVLHDNREFSLEHIHPNQALTLHQYRVIIEYFLNNGYQFLSLDALCDDLDKDGRYICLTFDDGYYNNLRLLPLIREYNVPIQIFVCTSNIINGTKFWWDVIYQERFNGGWGRPEIDREIERIKHLNYREIYKYVRDTFGKDAFTPSSDSDRPLTKLELRELSDDKLVSIGSHTHHHSILDKLSIREAEKEIAAGQDAVESIIGKKPTSFAYPNGNYNTDISRAVQKLGVTVAFTCDYRVNSVPMCLHGFRKLQLGRFGFSRNLDLSGQCKMFRCGISPWLIASKANKYQADLRRRFSNFS